MERKKGTVGNDTLTGTNLSDALYGLAGNDRLSGLRGADILYGDAGNDTLIGGGGADTLYGGVGNDLYVVDSAGDLIWEPTASTSPVLASVTASGAQGDSESNTPAISSDGRFIAFVSFADNLVGDDTNARADVFRKDLVTGAITRVSTGSGGEEADSGGRGPSISGDGRLVAFYSNSATLVAGDANGASDVFVKDVATGALTRVSTSSGGAEANGASGNPVISEDGRYVAFKSGATNLVGIDTNGALDVFVKDRVSGTTTIASTSSAGVQANAGSELCDITPGGRYVLLYSPASNLVAGDTNGWADVFVKDCVTKTITRVSTSGTGQQGNNSSFGGAITPDGRYVLFESFASNLVAGDTNGVSDVFLKDRVTGATTRVSTSALGAQGNASSAIGCGISDDGRYVIFASEASNLAPGDTNGKLDAFVKDTVSGAVARVSVSAAGLQGDRESSPVTISGDGRWISIDSMATNLVAGDANDSNDVFRVNNPLLAGGGVDTVQSSVSYTLPAGIENLALLGAAALNGAGNGLANRLTGNGAANLLDGGAGSDVMIGGAGNDTYVVGAAGDVVTELAGGGTDTVRSGTSYTLPLNVERLVLTGSAALNGTGNSGNNVLTGNAAANLLNGAAGNDTLIGGAGNDTYVVNGGDTVAEGLNAGTDTVQSGVNTPALATNVENLVLTGTALTGTGNGLNNILTGNGLANVLTGLGGNDTLNGGLGNDRMIGGNGNDTYVVNAIGDIVTELAGAGTDTVRTALAWTLGANLENLTLTGLTHVAGTGNTLANVLTGNNGDNALVGMAGNDTLNGGPGVDTLTGGGGSDVFAFTTEPGATNFEVIVDFEVGVDKIVLENAVFTALATPGALSPDNFSANPATADATDHVIYDPADGRLYYDADGAGVGLDDMQIARLSTSLYTLSAADFLIT